MVQIALICLVLHLIHLHGVEIRKSSSALMFSWIPQGFQEIFRQLKVFTSVYGSGSRNSGHETSGYASAGDSPGFPEIDAISIAHYSMNTIAHYSIIHPHIA